MPFDKPDAPQSLTGLHEAPTASALVFDTRDPDYVETMREFYRRRLEGVRKPMTPDERMALLTRICGPGVAEIIRQRNAR